MEHTLIDFKKPLKTYTTLSDATERAQGKSHGSLSYQDGINEKKHYFFAVINPQPNGAGFVSTHIPLKLSIAPHQSLCLTAEGLQETPTVFQLILNTDASVQHEYSYQATFLVEHKKTTSCFTLDDFSATYRGRPYLDAPTLDGNHIASIGVRIIGRDKAPNQGFQRGLYGLALYRLFITDV